MAGSRNFRDLGMWQKSHALTMQVYELTQGFPQEERFGLTSQMRRSAVSIPANIAEGCGRGGSAELSRFLTIAQGSASELEYLCTLAGALGMLQEGEAEELCQAVQEVARMINGYQAKLEADG
jgi:four helix bundle protein